MVFIRWPKKDARYRHIYLRNELNKLVLKSLLASSVYSWQDKFYWAKHFNKYSKKACIAFYHSSCLWTGTGRAVFRLFKLSRHWCKRFASDGLLLGMRKSSF